MILKQRLIAAQDAAAARDSALAELSGEVAKLSYALIDAQEERAALQTALEAHRQEIWAKSAACLNEAKDRLTQETAAQQALLQKSLRKRDRRLQASTAALAQTLISREDDFHELIYQLQSAQAVSQLSGEAARARIEYEHLLSEIRAIVRK